MNMLELTAENVQEVFVDSLFQDSAEDTSHVYMVRGIMTSFGFHPLRLMNNQKKITDFILQIPDSFKTFNENAQGDSFLNLCMTKDKRHWGEHSHMEMLCAMAEGLGLAHYPFPRAMWMMLPGSVPVICFVEKETPKALLDAAAYYRQKQ